jgi:N-acetylglucosamine kinase-like BadF-type ATPase
VTGTIVAGIDAGGSKTVCIIGDADSVLGRGTAGACNPNVVGISGVASAVSEALSVAWAQAQDHAVATRVVLGDLHGRLGQLWVGIAGAEWTTIEDAIAAEVEPLAGRTTVTISPDAALILPAAEILVGVALVAGTGSAAYGVGRDGRCVQAGGWGAMAGDEGSGHDLARQGIRAVTQAVDGRGPDTALVEAISAALGTPPTRRELMRRLNPAPPVSEVASLAPVVLASANQGDDVAIRLVADAADALARLVGGCARAVGLRPSEGPVDVVTAGGILSAASPVLLALEIALSAQGFRPRPLGMEPALGALALARELSAVRRRPELSDSVATPLSSVGQRRR